MSKLWKFSRGNKENTCSYCGSVLRLETFTNLYETSGKTKNLFKFSASEENTKGLNSEERQRSPQKFYSYLNENSGVILKE